MRGPCSIFLGPPSEQVVRALQGLERRDCATSAASPKRKSVLTSVRTHIQYEIDLVVSKKAQPARHGVALESVELVPDALNLLRGLFFVHPRLPLRASHTSLVCARVPVDPWIVDTRTRALAGVESAVA